MSAESVPVEELAAAAAGGDHNALAALFQRYADPVVRFIASQGVERETARDLAGDTWEKVARKIRDYRRRPDSGGFVGWLFTIARNTLNEWRRRTGRRPEYLTGEMFAFDSHDPGLSPADEVERRMDAHRIAAEVHSLPAAQRDCVLLRFFTELSIAETAEEMGKTIGSVKQLQLRGLRSLSRQLTKAGLTPPDRAPNPPDTVTQLEQPTTEKSSHI